MLERADEAPAKRHRPILAAALEFFPLKFGHNLKQGGPQHKTAPVAGAAVFWVAGRSSVLHQFGNDREKTAARDQQRAERAGPLGAGGENYQKHLKHVLDEPAKRSIGRVVGQPGMRHDFRERRAIGGFGHANDIVAR